MANDLTERSKNVSGSSQEKRRTDAAEGSGIGWGLSAEDQEERFFIRRIAFSLVVAVVACAGAYIVLTTLASRGELNLALSAKGTAPGAKVVYTVVLREVARGDLALMQQIVAADKIKALAGRNEFRSFELQDGSTAVCVGRFEDEDSPQIEQLLSKFREVHNPDGKRPFGAARIGHYRE